VLQNAEDLNSDPTSASSTKLSAKMISRVNAVLSNSHPYQQQQQQQQQQQLSNNHDVNKDGTCVIHHDFADAVKELSGIWGVGHATASKWASRGIRSVKELRYVLKHDPDRAAKLNVSRCQRIGLDRYEDLLDRMSRSEAEQIGNIVKRAVESILPGCEVYILLFAYLGLHLII
jgi:hypothetical protein